MLRFNKNKKAASFVMELVIIAAIALLVAIVLSTGLGKSFTNLFNQAFPKCEGTCKSSCDGYLDYQNGECPNNQVCCLPQPGTEADIATENTETPSVGTGTCKEKKEGDKCGTNQVCDANLVCVDKCIYCANTKTPKTTAGCSKFSSSDKPIKFESGGFSCKCTEQEYDALNDGGIKNIKGVTYVSASGFCSGSLYCCNNNDKKNPTVQVITTPIDPTAQYQEAVIAEVQCSDERENEESSGCKTIYYSVSSTSPKNFGFKNISASNHIFTINSKFLTDEKAIDTSSGFQGNIYLIVKVQDGSGHMSESKTIGPLKMILPGLNTACFDIKYNNTCREFDACFDDLNKLFTNTACVVCSDKNGVLQAKKCFADRIDCVYYMNHNQDICYLPD